MNFSTDSIQAVMSTLGNPQDQISVIHIAGTNGKGSVAAMLESVLRSSGYTTGLTISPHLVNERERIKLNGFAISLSRWQLSWDTIQTAEQSIGLVLSYFERVIAMAFLVFSQEAVDWAIVETGVGGRLDATNTVNTPAISVITSISLDHMEWLGNTISDIAQEKAGIIKLNVPVVLGSNLPPDAVAVILKIAEARHAPLIQTDAGRLQAVKSTRLAACYTDTVTSQTYEIPLLGNHQHYNLSTVLTTLQVLKQTNGLNVPLSALLDGLRQTSWPGRFQVIEDQQLIIDGSHNQEGFEMLRDTLLTSWRDSPLILIVTLKANRHSQCLVSLLKEVPTISHVITTEGSSTGLYHASQSLADQLQDLTYPALRIRAETDLATALKLAIACQHDNPNAWILITGSLYTVGEALTLLNCKV